MKTRFEDLKRGDDVKKPEMFNEMKSVAEILVHSSSETTKIYTHPNVELGHL